MIARHTTPARYRLDFEAEAGQVPAAWPEWQWVRLTELAIIVGRTQEQTYQTFKLLAALMPDGEGWSICPVQWVKEGTTSPRDGVFSEPQDFEGLYVPAGWSQDVLQAHGLGVTELRTRTYSYRVAEPRGTVRSYHMPERRITGDMCREVVIAYTGDVEDHRSLHPEYAAILRKAQRGSGDRSSIRTP